MAHRAGLDRAAVVEAAARLVDEEGVEQLSLGRLAERLGVRSPSLYNHVANKDEIIDGIDGNVFTRMNYAPAEFQNVKFEKVCEAPFVRIVALRDIAVGEELWVDYGPNYRYDFMNDPAVVKFFAALHARRTAAPKTAGKH